MRSKAVVPRKIWPTEALSERAAFTVLGDCGATPLTNPSEPHEKRTSSPRLLQRLFSPHLDPGNFLHGDDNRRKMLLAVPQTSRFHVDLLRQRW